ncbi:hypothetical protein BV898_19288 [Hypsibius exemplaris]|uniref:Uncharacterized protein n=1 Tax=Hypsibius exemplaris TaxID=2072580 RepID=A0A9X6NQF7_HYPEX|nr:hypothetical protein BV898_19288 [Hypsibius exemplaris]
MTVFVQDFANATLHQNDPIVGTVVLPLQGEQLYQTQLQNFGKGLQSFYDAAAANANTPNPGKWLDLILRSIRDTNLAKQVVANHDTSPKCLALAKVLAKDALEILNSVDQ